MPPKARYLGCLENSVFRNITEAGLCASGGPQWVGRPSDAKLRRAEKLFFGSISFESTTSFNTCLTCLHVSVKAPSTLVMFALIGVNSFPRHQPTLGLRYNFQHVVAMPAIVADMKMILRMRNILPIERRRACLLLMFAALLAACVPQVPSPAPEHVRMPAGFPEAYYRQIETRGGKVLRVDPHQSLVVIEVHRAGVLARLGHEHVVASHHVQGYVALKEGRSDLYIALDQLTLDEPGLRAEAKFDTQPSPEAIEGTRRNMQEKVLESQRFPFALIHIVLADAERSMLRMSLTLHGMTREWEIPVQMEILPDRIVVSGRMAFNQTDFGIVPFSVLGGALQVQDRLDLRFRILAGSD